VKKAMDQGVVVINIDNRLDPDCSRAKASAYPSLAPTTARRAPGRRLPGQPEAQGRRPGGIIEGVPTTTNAQQRTAGFKDAMDAAQMNDRLGAKRQLGDRQRQRRRASMLNEYPDLKALAGNDSMALGAVSACVLQDRPGASGGLRQHQRHQANACR
jgi:ribose transport system substrate-binding protein